MRLTVITPTCDRPEGVSLLERWMDRQTRQPDEWIVADGGSVPAVVSREHVHLHDPIQPGTSNFLANVSRGLTAATGDVIAIMEDDDWYAPTHLETLCRQLEPAIVLAAGDDQQRYYHLGRQLWRVFQNKGASLCQTAFKRKVLPLMMLSIEACRRSASYGIDTRFWSSVSVGHRSLQRSLTVVGMKGLAGMPGLGIGHRADGSMWTPDPDRRQLREWVGDDVHTYLRTREAA